MLTVLICNAQPTGLWTGRGENTKEFEGHLTFHAELGYWQFELSLRLRINPEIEILCREYEGTYIYNNDSVLVLYTEKFFVNGFHIPLDEQTRRAMTYSFIVLSPGVGGFGIVKDNRAYRMYTLYKQQEI